MDFIKKHYEKVILSAVLLALAVGAFLLTLSVEKVKAAIQEQGKIRTTRQKAAVKPIDLSTNQLALDRMTKGVKLDFSGAHNLANPVRWIEDRNKQVVRARPGVGQGPSGLVLVKQTPLNLLISFEGIAGTGDEIRYQFRVEKQYARKADARRPTVISTTLNNKTQDNLFTLREIRGDKSAPSELVIELLDVGERVVISKEKPYSRPLGFMADLRYEFEKKDFNNRRVDDSVVLGGKTYKIVAISKDEVVVSEESQKRTVVRAASAQ